MAQKYLDIAGLEYLWGKIIDAIPAKVSELTNDSGYLTSANLPTKLSDLLNDQGFVTLDDVQGEIEKLVNGAPEALDTLKELADALGNDKNFASTITGLIGEKAKDSEVLHLAGAETITGNKDFTGDLKKSGVSVATVNDIGDGTLTVKQNGVQIGTFAANQSSDAEIDIKIPTKMSDLEQDIDFDTDEDGNAKIGAGLLILQENGTQKGSFSANSAEDLTVNFLIPKKTSELENDAGFIKDIGSNPEAGISGIHYDSASGSLQIDGKTAATVNDIGNATITLKKGDETIDSFTTNASADKTIDLGDFATKEDLANNMIAITEAELDAICV